MSHSRVFWLLNLHREKQKQATSHAKVKHKLLFYLCLNHLPPSPLFLLCLLSLGSQAAVPQKADMPKLRGAGAMGGDGRLCGHLDRVSTEHMQQFSSAAPTYTFHSYSLDLQKERFGGQVQRKKRAGLSLERLRVWQKPFWSSYCDKWSGAYVQFLIVLCALKVAANKVTLKQLFK